MEVGDKVKIVAVGYRQECYLQAHFSFWIFRFGIVIGYPRPFIVKSIDKFGSVDIGQIFYEESLRPYKWWDYLKWR